MKPTKRGLLYIKESQAQANDSLNQITSSGFTPARLAPGGGYCAVRFSKSQKTPYFASFFANLLHMSEKSVTFAAPNANEHIMASKKINTAIITTRPHGNSLLEHRDEFETVCKSLPRIVKELFVPSTTNRCPWFGRLGAMYHIN